MTEEIEEGVYYTNNAEANGEEKFEITKAGYYGYLFFKCYKQVQVPNELDEVRENVISINIEQFKKVGGKKEFDDHSFVMKLKADYNKVVLIHDCTLISEVDRKNAKKELKLNK